MKQYVNPILNILELDTMDILTSSNQLKAVATSDDVLDHNEIFGITG